jgi:hypothetical protein
MGGNQFGKSSGAPCLWPKVHEKTKFAILGVEAPGRQVAKKPEYMDIPSFRTNIRKICIDVQKGASSLSETSAP